MNGHTELRNNVRSMPWAKWTISSGPMAPVSWARSRPLTLTPSICSSPAAAAARAAVDGCEKEPPRENRLLHHPNVVVTPHLGASTAEAQRRIGLEVADQVLAALAGRPGRGAVNAPVVQEEAWQRLGPFIELAGQLGRIAHQLAGGHVQRVEFSYEGEIASAETEWLQAAFVRA